ncbi:xylulose kinase-1, partial [Tanacetum coccineum]
YTDSDYARASLDRKSTTGGCQFLRSRLISWQCKKQTVVANSTTEAEYVATLSCRGQVNTVNREVQLQALANRKKIIVTEASVRRDLQLNDEEVLLVKNVSLDLSRLATTLNRLERSIQTGINMWYQSGLLLISRVTRMQEVVRFKASDVVVTVLDRSTANKELVLLCLVLYCQEVEEGEGSEKPTEPQTTPSTTQPSVGDQPHVTESSSGPDNTYIPSMNLEGTGGMKGIRVLALETAKDAQATKILKLKTRIKKLEKKCKPSILHHRAWLKSVKRLSMKKRLGKKEHVSKQGRKNIKPRPTLDAFDDLDANLAHGMDYMDIEEAMTEGMQSKETKELNVTHDTKVLEKGGSNEELVNAASNIGVSTAVNISAASRPEVSTDTPMTPPTSTSVFEDEYIFLADALVMLSDKEKLKGVEIKEKKDAERPARSVLTLKPLPKINPKDKGKGVLEEEPEPVKVISKDQGEAQIERDAEIALKVQAKLDKEARLERQRPRQEAVLYIKEQERATNFVPIRSEEYERLIQKMNTKVAGVHEEKVLEEPDSTKVEVKKEGHKENSDLEKEEHLKTFLKLVPDEEGIIGINEPGKRFTLINWEAKFYHLDRHEQNLEELYNLVMQRFESTTPEGVDLVLWGDLRTMFDANTEDELWQNQERWNLKSWNFYENCRVHTLTLEDGTEIHMHAERKYPLTKETLERMMSLKLIAESASESAYNLLRFIQKQIDEYGSYDGSEKDL